MTKKELLKRYVIFCTGVLTDSFGVALTTKAALGNSPTSAVPYSLSLIAPSISLGNWVIIFNVALVLSQLALQRKNAKKTDLLLQTAVSILFGKFVDFAMFCLQGFHPEMYVVRIVTLLAGCCVIAFSVYLWLIANVLMLPGDAFVRVLTKQIGKDHGSVRVVFDVSMSVLAGGLCLVFLHRLAGVREGTIISALLTGNMIRFYQKKLHRFQHFLLPENK